MLIFFFFNDTATTEIYTLSLHDALPIYNVRIPAQNLLGREGEGFKIAMKGLDGGDRKSTHLNSSHLVISYAVFCLKKKKMKTIDVVSYCFLDVRVVDVLLLIFGYAEISF